MFPRVSFSHSIDRAFVNSEMLRIHACGTSLRTDGTHIRFGQRGIVVAFAACRQSHCDRVPFVVGRYDIFKIGQRIIRFIPVTMIDFISVRDRSIKCLGNDAMNKYAPSGDAFREKDNDVAIQLEGFTNGSLKLDAPNPSLIRGFIPIVEWRIMNRAPVFMRILVDQWRIWHMFPTPSLSNIGNRIRSYTKARGQNSLGMRALANLIDLLKSQLCFAIGFPRMSFWHLIIFYSIRITH